MSHYGIVKRFEMEYAPAWAEQFKQYQHTNVNIIQYEESDANFHSMRYYNLIFDEVIKEELVTYWEGEINHDILNVGELLVIDDNSFEIFKVEKHTNGNVTYQVEAQLIKSEQYEDLLIRAKGHYNDYSNQLRGEKRNKDMQFRNKETWLGSVFRQLFINNK